MAAPAAGAGATSTETATSAAASSGMEARPRGRFRSSVATGDPYGVGAVPVPVADQRPVGAVTERDGLVRAGPVELVGQVEDAATEDAEGVTPLPVQSPATAR